MITEAETVLVSIEKVTWEELKQNNPNNNKLYVLLTFIYNTQLKYLSF